MKSKEQILDHLKEVGYTKSARQSICAYLVGKGIKKRDEVIAIKKGDDTFDEFLEWENHEDKTQEITLNPITTHWTSLSFFDELVKRSEARIPLLYARVRCNEKFNVPQVEMANDNVPEPKYKVGDWVRFFDSDSVVQIKHFTDDGDYFFTANGSWLPLKDVNPYYPKEGEFFVIQYTNYDVKWITNGEFNVSNCKYACFVKNKDVELLDSFTSILQVDQIVRPAIESEIKLLKDKVKEEYNKEWNGKEWVSIKKSDKELFEEWKKENALIGIINNPVDTPHEDWSIKIRDYKELYLFAQWVNQFYSLLLEDYIICEKYGRLYINGYTAKCADSSIRFISKEAAKRAIDCLGEELIKTALR